MRCLVRSRVRTRSEQKRETPGDRRRALSIGEELVPMVKETAGPRPGRLTDVGGVSEAWTDPQRVAPSRTRRPPAGRGRRISWALGRFSVLKLNAGSKGTCARLAFFSRCDVGRVVRPGTAVPGLAHIILATDLCVEDMLEP